jgi:hypothetical protein
LYLGIVVIALQYNTLILHVLELDCLAKLFNDKTKNCKTTSKITRGQNHMRLALWAKCNTNGEHQKIDLSRIWIGQIDSATK